MLYCLTCSIQLSGRKKKFCSIRCKHRSSNNKHQNYRAQHLRAITRKLTLIELKGGHCTKCGYNLNLAALCFHHRDETQKSFELDSRHLSNMKFSSILKEVSKCDLLCCRCHTETHNSHLNMIHLALSNVEAPALTN